MMARINSGINPKFLSDQHLIAESVEITMITGNLRKNNYEIKGDIPEKYCLGKGHMNFFKNKLIYLWHRINEVNAEMKRRGFNPGTKIDLFEFNQMLPSQPFIPSISDSNLVRERIVDRLRNPKKAKPGFHKFHGKPIEDIETFSYHLLHSELYFV